MEELQSAYGAGKKEAPPLTNKSTMRPLRVSVNKRYAVPRPAQPLRVSVLESLYERTAPLPDHKRTC